MSHPMLVYGEPPPSLVTVDAFAQQVSPWVVGAASLEACPPESISSAVIYAPPGTLERRYTLALALRALMVGAELIALAPNDKGGNRIAAELRGFGCTVTEDSRAHHRMCTTSRPASLHGIAEALEAGALQHHAATGLWTQPGLFSWDRADAGTALLLTHLPSFSGRGADLGCGLGVLSRAVLQSPSVTALTLVDGDRRAIAAAQRNVDDPRAEFLWADVRHVSGFRHSEEPKATWESSDSGLPRAYGARNDGAHSMRRSAELDFIVMNPPFHEGGIENQTLGQAFITRAAQWLKPGGVCWLTANRHLPYEALLAAHFCAVTLVDTAGGFKIYRAET